MKHERALLSVDPGQDLGATVQFFGEPGDPALVQLGPGNEIRVRGKLICEDAEVVEGLRAFLRGLHAWR